MDGTGRSDASIQAFFPPTPNPSPIKKIASTSALDASIGDGFTDEEVREALKPTPLPPWQPPTDYTEFDILDLSPGSRAVTFTGRVASIFNVACAPKTASAARGYVKLCVKDDTGAITIRLWHYDPLPALRLGSLTTIWTSHISRGENGTLTTTSAPLFSSIFPERDRSCHLKVHESQDNSELCTSPLDYFEGCPLTGLMTLQDFIDGGYEVADAKILVLVKCVGARKGVVGNDGSATENVNLQVHDHTAEATLGLWGIAALSPFSSTPPSSAPSSTPSSLASQGGWKQGDTVLLIQAPNSRIGRTKAYLSLTATSFVDVDPSIPDAHWLRNWALRQRTREALNPPFPEGVFDYEAVTRGPVRCLYTLAELDAAARASPTMTLQGYLSLLITDVKIIDCWRRRMLLSGECCNTPVGANAMSAKCRVCGKDVPLRLNPRIVGQVIDETAAIGCGRLLFSDTAWWDLLGRGASDLLKMGSEGLKGIEDRLLFCRVTVIFGWTGDESKTGGRICVMGVRS